MPIVKQANILGLALVCVGACSWLSMAKSVADVYKDARDAPVEGQVYLARASVGRSAPMTATTLRAGTRQVALGEVAQVELAADERGVARLPLSMDRPGARPGQTAPLLLLPEVGGARVEWDGARMSMGGFEPGAIYKAEVGLMLWSAPKAERGAVQAPAFKAFGAGARGMECVDSCVASVSRPTMVRAGSGPWWRKAYVWFLSTVHWADPLIFLLCAMAWRGFGRGSARLALSALGLPNPLPLRAAPPQPG